MTVLCKHQGKGRDTGECSERQAGNNGRTGESYEREKYECGGKEGYKR